MSSPLGQTVQRFFERQLAPPAALTANRLSRGGTTRIFGAGGSSPSAHALRRPPDAVALQEALAMLPRLQRESALLLEENRRLRRLLQEAVAQPTPP